MRTPPRRSTERSRPSSRSVGRTSWWRLLLPRPGQEPDAAPDVSAAVGDAEEVVAIAEEAWLVGDLQLVLIGRNLGAVRVGEGDGEGLAEPRRHPQGPFAVIELRPALSLAVASAGVAGREPEHQTLYFMPHRAGLRLNREPGLLRRAQVELAAGGPGSEVELPTPYETRPLRT